MSEQPIFSDRDKFEAAHREVKMRIRLYRRWVDEGRMKRSDADHEIALMTAIANDYREKVEAQQAKERLL